MKRTVCVLVPLVCGFSLTRIDFPRDSHPSRSCLLGNPLQCRGRARQGSCLLGHSHIFFVAASVLPRCTCPLLCPHEGSQHIWLLSIPLSEWRPGAKRPACPLRQKSPIGQAYSQFLNSPTRLPRLTIPKTPHPGMRNPPAPTPLPRSCTMHNALQHLNPPRSNNGQPGHVLGTPLFAPCRNVVFGRALQCDTHCTHRLCCNTPSLFPHDICNPTHLHTRAATGIGLIT